MMTTEAIQEQWEQMDIIQQCRWTADELVRMHEAQGRRADITLDGWDDIVSPSPRVTPGDMICEGFTDENSRTLSDQYLQERMEEAEDNPVRLKDGDTELAIYPYVHADSIIVDMFRGDARRSASIFCRSTRGLWYVWQDIRALAGTDQDGMILGVWENGRGRRIDWGYDENNLVKPFQTEQE